MPSTRRKTVCKSILTANDNGMAGFDVNTARLEYDELGFDTLPLIPGSKAPLARSWQSRPVNRLWRNAPQDANIGIRGGGLASVAILDCDEPQTFDNLTRWLVGLGYQAGDYPTVRTASGEGRHIYTTFGGDLSGDWRVLSKEIGAGEFRYGAGAFVVAPPSMVNGGGAYELISGDFARLPSLALDDVLQIVGNQETQPAPKKPTLPRKAIAMLHGRGLDGYKTNSEAEQALLTSLINAGFEFADVLDLFNRHPCAGKYAELKAKSAKNAERWLHHSFNEAAQWAKTHESPARQTTQAAIAWAESRAWPGRTGAVDRLVFIAHAMIAHRAGRLVYAAACRDLAEQAGISRMTATNATHRLCNAGLLAIETPATVDCAKLYRLKTELDKLGHFLKAPIVRKCQTLSTNHDVFRFMGLGKSAGEIWQVLQDAPATVDELAEKTGRHVKTIKRALERLANLADPLTGEFLPMVASDDPQGASSGEIYHALPVDLDRIAHAIGTAGAGQRQKELHAKERREHARSLMTNKQAQDKQR